MRGAGPYLAAGRNSCGTIVYTNIVSQVFCLLLNNINNSVEREEAHERQL
jgi:hypothetical protein